MDCAYIYRAAKHIKGEYSTLRQVPVESRTSIIRIPMLLPCSARFGDFVHEAAIQALCSRMPVSTQHL